MAAFTWTSKIDSKGRVTIPARIRNKLNINEGDKLKLSLEDAKVIENEFDSSEEALDFLSSLDDIESYSFDGETLKVVIKDD